MQRILNTMLCWRGLAWVCMGLGLGLGFGVVAAGCAPLPAEEARLVPTFRASCGRSALSYDITCATSLQVRVWDSQNEVRMEACTAVQGRYPTIQSILADKERLRVLEGAPLEADMRIEMRFYHALQSAPCADLSDDDLMLWGSSQPIDLNEALEENINVVFECRPGCDCKALDDAPERCDVSLEPGACFPPATTACTRPCSDASDCFGGLLACMDGRCKPSNDGGGCSPCQSQSDCLAGHICGRNPLSGAQICGVACPNLGGLLSACPQRMACQALDVGGQSYVTLP